MKYQKILGLVATAGLFLAGCATDTDTQNAWFNDSNAVRISASVGNATTRSNPTATDDAGLTSFMRFLLPERYRSARSDSARTGCDGQGGNP